MHLTSELKIKAKKDSNERKNKQSCNYNYLKHSSLSENQQRCGRAE